VFVVENYRVGGKLLCEKSLLPRLAPMSSFEVIYKMERDYAWCLTDSEVNMELFFSNEAISLALRTARKSLDMNGNATL